MLFRSNPHRTIHLGDFIDTAAFRNGAAGTSDETASLSSDLGHGLNFLKALEPTDVLIGNHEERLYTAMHHYNAIRSEAARWMVEDVRRTVRGLKASFTETYDVNSSWLTLGDTKFLHGFMYNENAIRDHAEHFGKCVIAHLHMVGEQEIGRAHV